MLGSHEINTTRYPVYAGEAPPSAPLQKRSITRPLAKIQVTREGFDFPSQEIVSSSESLGWQNLEAFLVRHKRSAQVARTLRRHCLILQLGNSIAIDVSLAERTIRRILRTGEMIILPAGTSVRLDWREDESNEALFLYLDPVFLEGIAEDLDATGQLMLEPVIGLDDDQLRYGALSLLCELKDENSLSSSCADQIGRVLGLRIIRRCGHFQEHGSKQGGMAPFRLRKALDFINENLESEKVISLEKVAGWVGLSYFHFSRTFKQSMGISPNNYIVSRRIEKAKGLLANSDSPIADIALQVGFASQSHFTTMFRRSTGTTPSIFRRA